MIRQNPFRGPHLHHTKYDRHSWEEIKILNNYSSSNEMRITSLSITITVMALLSDRGGGFGLSNKALVKANTRVKDPALSSSRTVVRIPDTVKISKVDGRMGQMALHQLTLGHLYEPSSSYVYLKLKGGGGC